MDTSWIEQPRNSEACIKGVCDFMKFAKKGAQNGKIRCPCSICKADRKKILPVEEVENHILFKGFYKEYKIWIFHGPFTVAQNVANQRGRTFKFLEQSQLVGQDDIRGLLNDVIGFHVPDVNELVGYHSEQLEIRREVIEGCEVDDMVDDQTPNEQPGIFTSEEADLCFSVLSFTLRLFHLKCMFNWPNKSFSMLIELLLEAFPQITKFPSSYYEAKKMIMDLGVGYDNIHACPNNCTLYWGEMSEKDSCPFCSISRWKNSDSNNKIPRKVMKYFPLIPRLKRMYMSSKIAKDMRWHDMCRNKDNIIRHPADAKAWKEFDVRYPEFANDPRSVRMGLATDGFNPYRLMNTTYSTWPIILIPYNLPPWLCMKPSSLILSMIIPGKEGPGNNIDVYMQPLIHELMLLWNGVPAFDSFSNETFNLRAALMWTINDFPAYAMLSGWSTKGYNACPECTSDTSSIRVGNKICYMRHRRWLPSEHPFRFQSSLFDGSEEYGVAPTRASGTKILREQEKVEHVFGMGSKSSKKRKKSQGGTSNDEVMWTKKSILFELPYWEYNLLRHNLDFMHIQKNIGDNVIATIMNVEGRSRDDEAAREFLRERNVKPHLWLQYSEHGEPLMPPAPYCMSSEQKVSFLRVLAAIKFPDGYASNLSRCVNLKNKKLTNLKSHDIHILMQDVLPVALMASRSSPEEVIDLLNDLSSWFKSLCSKEIDPSDIFSLQLKINEILCRMEIEFLPPFFTIMVHLLIHLVNEVRLGGPIRYRWMYPIERYLGHLKTYVRNRAQPEGSIAEGYILDETITFCSRYLEGVETIYNRPRRNDCDCPCLENYFLNSGGRPIGKEIVIRIPNRDITQIHRYVLTQFQELIEPFTKEFVSQKQRGNNESVINEAMINKWKMEEFPSWFRSQVNRVDDSNPQGRLLKALACGPTCFAKRTKGYIINGVKFTTLSREKMMKTQNSGVMVVADGNKYYGKLTDILEVDYHGTYKVVVFRCDWVNINGGVDDTGKQTRVNFSKLMHTGRFLSDEPFVIASQVKQVFYVSDLIEKEWHYVIETSPRDVYELGHD